LALVWPPGHRSNGFRLRAAEAGGDRTTWTYDAAYQLRREQRTGAVAFTLMSTLM